MKTLYTAKATSTGGREGHGRTDDGALDVKLVSPKDGGGTNPEQLFAVGYSACFLGAVKAAAKKTGVEISEDANVSAEVSLTDRDDGEGFWIKVALKVSLPGLDTATAEDVIKRAHVICPYSEISRKGFNVELDLA